MVERRPVGKSPRKGVARFALFSRISIITCSKPITLSDQGRDKLYFYYDCTVMAMLRIERGQKKARKARTTFNLREVIAPAMSRK